MTKVGKKKRRSAGFGSVEALKSRRRNTRGTDRLVVLYGVPQDRRGIKREKEEEREAKRTEKTIMLTKEERGESTCP